MRKAIALIVLLASLSMQASAQHFDSDRNEFPVFVAVHFHALNLPLKQLGSNFQNMGIGIGTEISLNQRRNLGQQIGIYWSCNKNLGHRLLTMTQTVWRPNLIGGLFSEIKVGAGFTRALRPGDSYQWKSGAWKYVGSKGKTMLSLPIGISIGFEGSKMGFSPFASYQFVVLNNYNPDIPLVPETYLHFGSRFNFLKS